MPPLRSKFQAPINGFGFPNSFPFSFAASSLVGTHVDMGELILGLCGGMCFASMDYFYNQRVIPSYQKVDDLPPGMVRYLWGRQFDSLGWTVVPKLIEWSLRSDADLLTRTLRYEVPKIRRRLEKEDPAPLVLMRSSGSGSLTQNHQVLALSIEQDFRTGATVIWLYDPNHPRKTPNLRLSRDMDMNGKRLVQSTGEDLRGFFVTKYRLKTPPEVL